MERASCCPAVSQDREKQAGRSATLGAFFFLKVTEYRKAPSLRFQGLFTEVPEFGRLADTNLAGDENPRLASSTLDPKVQASSKVAVPVLIKRSCAAIAWELPFGASLGVKTAQNGAKNLDVAQGSWHARTRWVWGP